MKDNLKFWEWHIFDGFDWGAAATLIAAVVAVLGVVVTILATSAANRRERRAAVYAEAIRAVSDYLEGPYRVARCHNSAEQRFALSTDLSDVQGRIDAHKVLLSLHGPQPVADAYDKYVAVARQEAGSEMAAMWDRRPAKRHRAMNVGRRFDRRESNRAKEVLIKAMDAAMRERRWFS